MARSDTRAQSVRVYHELIRAAQRNYEKEFGHKIAYKDVQQADWFKEDYKFLKQFKEKDREDRTRQEWVQFEDIMEEIYGEEEQDWGDY